MSCDCGSRREYDACCGTLHAGTAAPTAERLMRSRYSAYVRSDRAYLLWTWHPDSRPGKVDLDPGMRWTGLQIVARGAGGMLDARGTVTFAASYSLRGAPGVLHEQSAFVREAGQWLYVGPV